MEDYQKRLLDEYNELKERMSKLADVLNDDEISEKVGYRQYKLMDKQLYGMEEYFVALEERLVDMGLI